MERNNHVESAYLKKKHESKKEMRKYKVSVLGEKLTRQWGWQGLSIALSSVLRLDSVVLSFLLQVVCYCYLLPLSSKLVAYF